MWFPKDKYIEAHNYAVTQARKLNQCYGLEAMPQYGKPGFSVKMIPNDPNKRFGWEMRCEAITPQDFIWEVIGENNVT